MYCDNLKTEKKEDAEYYLTAPVPPTTASIFRRELEKEFKYNYDLFCQDLLDIDSEFYKEYDRFLKTNKKDSQYYSVKAKYDILLKMIENYLEGVDRCAGYLVSDHTLEGYGNLMKDVRNAPYDVRDKYFKKHKDDPDFQKLNAKVRENNSYKGVDIRSSSGGKKSANSSSIVGVIWGYKL